MPGQQNLAAGVNDLARELGAATRIAIAESVLAAGYQHSVQHALPMLSESMREPVSQSLAATLAAAPEIGSAAESSVEVAGTAFAHGFGTAALVLGFVNLAGAVALVLHNAARLAAIVPVRG
ncbi:hypothetical protein ACWIGW_32115 [Nocardia brasiliensis]